MWAQNSAAKIKTAVLMNDWGELALLMPEVASKLATVKLPKSNTLGRPWKGAMAELKKRAESEKVKSGK